jgi:hypothetical protein
VLCWFSLGHYNHNDHMYAVAPVMAARLRAYTDFAFVQTPLSLLAGEGVLRLVGEARLYAGLRLGSLALNLLIIAAGAHLARRHAARGGWAAFAFVCLYVAFRPDDLIGAEIGNYTLTLGLTVAALVCLDRFAARAWAPVLVGLLTGLALSAKLSSIFVAAAFALIVLLWGTAPRGWLARLAAYALGGLAGVSPILFFLARDPDRFLFENVHFHYLSNFYRGITPLTGLASLPLFSASSGLLSLGLLTLAGALVWGAGLGLIKLFPRLRVLVLPLTAFEAQVLILAGAFVVGAVTPGVVFQQYQAAPAFALMLFAVVYLDRLLASGRLGEAAAGRARTAVTAIAVLLAVLMAVGLAGETWTKQRDGAYAFTSVAAARTRLAGAIAAIDRAHPGCHDDLVTAFGVPALGAGARLSPIASTGSFAMRLDDIFAQRAPDQRWMSDAARSLTPRSLILTGFYAADDYEPRSPFEAVMRDYAVGHGFTPVSVGPYVYKAITLYAPPGCAAR